MINLDDKAHIEITKKAIKLSKVNLNENEVLTLTKYCIKPDYDERDYAYAYHFYNPVTKTNFNGGNITALSKFKDHFKKAKEKNSLEELGRAIHFLEDLNTPVHCGYEDTLDSVTRLKQHMEFEKMCDDLVDKIDISNVELTTDYLNSDLDAMAKNCAAQSYVYFKELDKKSTNKKMIGERVILRAIQAVTGVINHYYAKQV